MAEKAEDYREKGLRAIRETGDAGLALAYFAAALKSHGEESGPSSDLIWDLLLVGQAQFALGKTVRAQTTVQRALAIARNLAPHSAETLVSLMILADVIADSNPQTASDLREQARAIPEPIDFTSSVNRLYLELVLLALRQGELETARARAPSDTVPDMPLQAQAWIGAAVGAAAAAVTGFPVRSNKAIHQVETAWIDEGISKLKSGQVLFDPPTEMQVGVQEAVFARIANSVEVELRLGLVGRGVPMPELIRVGPLMRMTLTGQPSFEIVPQSEPQQIVENSEFTQWAWDVTPVLSGIRKLRVRATVVLVHPGYPEHVKDLGVFDRDVVVKVNRAYSAGRIVQKHWQWFIGTLMAIVMACFAAISILLKINGH